MLKVFTDNTWIDEIIDLINDDKLKNNNKALDGEWEENLKLIETLELQLEEAQNKIKELLSKKSSCYNWKIMLYIFNQFKHTLLHYTIISNDLKI